MDYEVARRSLRRAQDHLEEAAGRHLLASDDLESARAGGAKEALAKAERAMSAARAALVLCAQTVAALKESLK